MNNDAITRLNQHQSPLLRLPAELRNKIYEYALQGNTIHVHQSHIWDETRSASTEHVILRTDLYLEHASRQVRSEFASLYNADSSFHASNTFQGSDHDLISFLSSIGARKHLVRSVCVDTRDWEERTCSRYIGVATVLNYVLRVLHGLEKFSILFSTMDKRAEMDMYMLNEFVRSARSRGGRDFEVVVEVDGQHYGIGDE